MKFIRAGYTKFLNMFKNFLLASQPYTHEKNTIRTARNGLEWPGMTPPPELNRILHSPSFGNRFSTVGLGYNEGIS